MTSPGPQCRIVIVGSTSSGKTTLARVLEARLGLPHVELDALHWEANWSEAPTDVFRERVARALSGDSWIVDGNYSKVRDLVWARADALLWLDYALPVILRRLTVRTTARLVRRTELWNGNTERWSEVFSRNSLFAWAVTTYSRRRREYAELLSLPDHAHLRIFHFHSPRDTAAWLAHIEERVTRS